MVVLQIFQCIPVELMDTAAILIIACHFDNCLRAEVASSPASCASLRPAARLVDPLQDRPILHLAGHCLSDRVRTPVPEWRNGVSDEYRFQNKTTVAIFSRHRIKGSKSIT